MHQNRSTISFSKGLNRAKNFVNDKKNTSYFTATLSLFCLSFFGVFAIRPTLITASTLIKSINELRRINTDYENKINTIIKAQTEYERIRKNIRLIYSAIPANPSFPQLAKKLEEFATVSGISITQIRIDDISVSDLPPSDKLLKYGFSLTALGDYHSINEFLHRLNNWKRIVNVQYIDLSLDSTSGARLKISLKGNTFYEP